MLCFAMYTLFLTDLRKVKKLPHIYKDCTNWNPYYRESRYSKYTDDCEIEYGSMTHTTQCLHNATFIKKKRNQKNENFQTALHKILHKADTLNGLMCYVETPLNHN